MIIKMENVCKRYNHFNLECTFGIEPGSITGIVGQNGAGKSTIFKLLLGLVHSDSGSIQVLGKNPGHLNPSDKEKIGVVLAESGFCGYLTIKSLLTVLKSMFKNFDSNKFAEECKRFGLPLDKKIESFSTGMKAKLKLLIALCHDAQLLILDEPTAGLDVVARDELLDILRSYMEQGQRTILISSHISGDLENLCDDLYVIHEGRIVLHEEMGELLDSYGLIKADDKAYAALDKSYILKVRQESYGYSCLTNKREFYAENYPGIVIEKGNIDELITMIVKGENI